MKKILIAGSRYDYGNYAAALRACQADTVISLDIAQGKDCDGLLLPGGADIDPSLYGQENHGSRQIDRDEDLAQLRLLGDFIRAGKPVLGICKGHQVINVYFGGTLVQHMATASLHQPLEGDGVHDTFAVSGSVLERLYGAHFPTNSCHHQAIGCLGNGLIPILFTADHAIEAMIHERLPILSLQWHPERMMLLHRRPDTVDGTAVFRQFMLLFTGYP